VFNGSGDRREERERDAVCHGQYGVQPVQSRLRQSTTISKAENLGGGWGVAAWP
jgi:hypothetical protein